jgi:hypothetical protein
MEHYQHKELLDIKSIIQFGNRIPELFPIPFLKEVYGIDRKVKIRGLSNFEYDEIAVRMYEVVKDTKTINYLFNPKNEDEIEKEIKKEKSELIENKEDSEKLAITEVDKEYPEYVNQAQLTHAYLIRNAFIVFYAMKDYYLDLTLDQVRQIDGLVDIAKRVNEKSGRTPEIMEKIEFFREQQKKLNVKVSDK